MRRLALVMLFATLVHVTTFTQSRPRIRQHGRATVEYSTDTVKAVAAYEYSRRNHDGPWLLIEFAIVAKERIAIHRDQIGIIAAEGRRIPVSSQQMFLKDHDELNKLLQNAVVSRHPLDSYFVTRPQPTIRFFSFPGAIVHDTFVTNQDEAAQGDLLFKSPDGTWKEGTYRLVVDHEHAKVELPISLQ
jgi:hypothetical protein